MGEAGAGLWGRRCVDGKFTPKEAYSSTFTPPAAMVQMAASGARRIKRAEEGESIVSAVPRCSRFRIIRILSEEY